MLRLFRWTKTSHWVQTLIVGCLLATIALFLNCEVAQKTRCLNGSITFNCTSTVELTNAITITKLGANFLGIQWEKATDAKTPQADLAYRVVYTNILASLTDRATQTPSPNGVTVATDWSKDMTQTTVVGLKPKTKYYVGLYVRNPASQTMMLGQKEVTTAEADAPTIGTPIAFANITSSSVTVSWGAASDLEVSSDRLEYRVVHASSKDLIDNISEVKGDLAAGVTLDQDWSLATTTLDVASLANGTSYYFAVAVRGAYEDYSLYEPALMQTLDDTAPTVGVDISYTDITTSTLTVSWGIAVDNASA